MFILIFSFSANASCCQFKDPKNTYFELGSWDKATYFCSKMDGVTGYNSVYSSESCSSLDIPAGYCDGWTECNTNIPTPSIGSSSYSSITCTESWKCNEYGSCANNMKYRYCYDVNNCGTALKKPTEKETCFSQNINSTVNETNPQTSQNENSQENTGNNYLNQITGAAIGTNMMNSDLINAIIALFSISLLIIFLKLSAGAILNFK